jgi:phosphoglycerate dehydrogenase-like enzyme
VRIVVAVHDPPVWTLPPAEVARIARALPDDDVTDARTTEERRAAFPDADVVLASRMTEGEFLSARRLRWIQSSAVGVGGVLSRAVVESDVIVTNARGLHADALAEHAVALALAVRRRLHVAVARQMTRTWAQAEFMAVRTPALADARILVVGLGEIAWLTPCRTRTSLSSPCRTRPQQAR